jgi:hypothetical protein
MMPRVAVLQGHIPGHVLGGIFLSWGETDCAISKKKTCPPGQVVSALQVS